MSQHSHNSEGTSPEPTFVIKHKTLRHEETLFGAGTAFFNGDGYATVPLLVALDALDVPQVVITDEVRAEIASHRVQVVELPEGNYDPGPPVQVAISATSPKFNLLRGHVTNAADNMPVAFDLEGKATVGSLTAIALQQAYPDLVIGHPAEASTAAPDDEEEEDQSASGEGAQAVEGGELKPSTPATTAATVAAAGAAAGKPAAPKPRGAKANEAPKASGKKAAAGKAEKDAKPAATESAKPADGKPPETPEVAATGEVKATDAAGSTPSDAKPSDPAATDGADVKLTTPTA